MGRKTCTSKSERDKMRAISKLHSQLYGSLNRGSNQLLAKHGHRLPPWVTANSVTSGRLSLTIPTTLLLSQGFTFLPATLILVNAVFDYVDGALARWEKQKPVIDHGKLISNFRTRALHSNWGAYYGKLKVFR